MYKVIFFDVDGTLVSHAKNAVPESTRAAIKKLRQQGIKCVLATGRHITEVEALPLRDMDFDAYITLVGQLCLDKNKKPLFQRPFPPEDRDRFIKLFNEGPYPMQLAELREKYGNFTNERVARVQQDVSTALPAVRKSRGEDIFQVALYVDSEEEAALSDYTRGHYVTRWHNEGLDILPAGGGKVPGIEEYLRLMGVERQEAMAFGDGDNDVDMLRFVGLGVAMGNGVEQAKDASDYVTADIDDDGIEKALIHFGLI